MLLIQNLQSSVFSSELSPITRFNSRVYISLNLKTLAVYWFPLLASFCLRRADSLLAVSSSFRVPVKALLPMKVTWVCWPSGALAAVWSLVALGSSWICVNHFLLLCSSLFSVKGYTGVKVSVVCLSLWQRFLCLFSLWKSFLLMECSPCFLICFECP